MKKKFIYLLSLSTLLLSACSTELDVIGKYKETMVVYGLLDQSQPKQYIKINKAFLGEGNAFTYAKIKDSTQFVHSLTVKIRRLSDGVEFPLTPDNSIVKQPGFFYSPDQTNVIYSFTPQPNALNTSSSYQLIVKNSDTGTEVTSQTSLLSDATITAPAQSSALHPVFSFIYSTNNNPVFNISWNSGKGARMYQTIIRFHYLDSTMLGSSAGNDTSYIDWVFPVQTTIQGLEGGEQMTEQFNGQSYLEFIGNQLGSKPVPSNLIARRALKTDIILVSGSDDLNTFIEVNAPSTGIVQEKPEYTNITNGLGIFSARYNKAPYSRDLSGPTLDELACGQYTNTLKFLKANGLLCQ